jgi:hypothetical protein
VRIDNYLVHQVNNHKTEMLSLMTPTDRKFCVDNKKPFLVHRMAGGHKIHFVACLECKAGRHNRSIRNDFGEFMATHDCTASWDKHKELFEVKRDVVPVQVSADDAIKNSLLENRFPRRVIEAFEAGCSTQMLIGLMGSAFRDVEVERAKMEKKAAENPVCVSEKFVDKVLQMLPSIEEQVMPDNGDGLGSARPATLSFEDSCKKNPALFQSHVLERLEITKRHADAAVQRKAEITRLRTQLAEVQAELGKAQAEFAKTREGFEKMAKMREDFAQTVLADLNATTKELNALKAASNAPTAPAPAPAPAPTPVIAALRGEPIPAPPQKRKAKVATPAAVVSFVDAEPALDDATEEEAEGMLANLRDAIREKNKDVIADIVEQVTLGRFQNAKRFHDLHSAVAKINN